MFSAYCIPCRAYKLSEKRKERKRNKCDEEEDKPLTNTEAVNSNNEAVISKNEGLFLYSFYNQFNLISNQSCLYHICFFT